MVGFNYYFIKSKYIFIVGLFTIPVMFYFIFFDPFIILSENQIMYTFSAASQVVAALYGLMITGFIFYEGKLNETISLVQDGSCEKDFIDSLKRDYHGELMFISITTGISLLLSLSVISINNYNFLGNIDKAIFISLSSGYAISTIISIILFSLKVTNPMSAEAFTRKDKYEIEKEIGKMEDINAEEQSINGELYFHFMKKYNELEDICKELINNNGIEANKSINTLYSSSKILLKLALVSDDIFEKMAYIRRYRNTLVHGEDYTISTALMGMLDEVLSELKS